MGTPSWAVMEKTAFCICGNKPNYAKDMEGALWRDIGLVTECWRDGAASDDEGYAADGAAATDDCG